MKTNIAVASVIRLLMLVVLGTTISSFTSPLGMDSYKVYLNDKLLFKQFMTKDAPMQTISLNENSNSDQLTVYYDHCGRIGTGRTLSLLDGQQVLKKWDYQDTQSVQASGMVCKVGDINAFHKAGKTMKLVYDSKELSTPLTLVTIAAAGTNAKANR
ncbi:MAG TPA: hypothetical protein VFW11_24455 [Cyclobacteriaceae bacterium]|nr:hypothetical protein [Cyclobacteriaceae bacterium]